MTEVHLAPGTPIVMDLARVADTLSVSESTVQKLVREGAFPRPRMLSSHRVGWLTNDVVTWAAQLPAANMLPPPNTGAPKRRKSQSAAS